MALRSVERRCSRPGSAVTWLLLCIAAATGSVWGQSIAPQIFEVRSPMRGSSWIALEWDSTVLRHDVIYGELRRGRVASRDTRVVKDINAIGYSVINLKPETTYEFRVRAYPLKEGAGKPVVSEPVEFQTLSPEARGFSGLLFWPQQPLGTSSKALTEACIESYRGKLYVLEVEQCVLRLSQVDPQTLKADWTRDVTPDTGEEATCYEAPDMCVFQEKLWITWHVRLAPEGGNAGAVQIRQRLMSYDLALETAGDAPEDNLPRVSAPLQIAPRRPERNTSDGTVVAYLDKLWVSWLEAWVDEQGRRTGRLRMAPYEPWRGQLAAPVSWRDCPVACPENPSVGTFGGNLVILFSNQPTDPGQTSGPLMFAQFDGRRFYDVRILRGLGRNFNARGVQLYDRFYYVYQSDANYPAGGGMYYDIPLGMLMPGRHAGSAEQSDLSALPLVTDMKYNHRPDIAVLGDTMYMVCAKRDQAVEGMLAAQSPGGPVRGFGTYLGKITRSVGRAGP